MVNDCIKTEFVLQYRRFDTANTGRMLQKFAGVSNLINGSNCL